MSNYATDVPLINVPFVRPDGHISEAWFMFLIQLWRRTGATSGTALDDLATDAATLADDPVIAVLSQALKDINVQLQTVPDAAQDALVKAQRTNQDAIIDQLTPLDPIRSMAYQDASNVKITGGTIDGTAIGGTTAAAAKFTTVAASGQITSTVATGTAPFVVASTTVVPNLHVATADSLGTAGSYPPDATDLPSVITLANYIKSRNISKGV
jgi:hypothetical protein